MLFNSFSFILFFAVFGMVYYAMGSKLRLFVLLLASIIFYCSFSFQGLLILAGVIVFNFYSGLFIEKWERKGRVLVISIVVNVGLLFVYKYFDFFNASFSNLLSMVGINNPVPFLHLIVPAGISYYTLQAISYNVDVYNELQEAEKKFPVFATYFLFFPKIVQGPVERPRNLLPQLHERNEVGYANITSGLKLIVWGFFKKVVIADRLSILVDHVYANPHNYEGLSLIVAGVFYTVQLYADFSGYTDMALGLAEMMGFKMIKNFNHPFASVSVTDFWKRWHISFSTWLYEYIYNPLSLTKRKWGTWGMVYALMITFTISGLWHQVSWTFVLWGVFNGIALSYEMLTAKARKKFWKKFPEKTAKAGSIAITFIFVCMSMAFERAKNVADAFYIMKSSVMGLKGSIIELMHGRLNIHEGMTGYDFKMGIAAIFIMQLMQYFQYKGSIRGWVFAKPMYLRWAIYYLLVLAVLWFGVYENRKFIYAQF